VHSIADPSNYDLRQIKVLADDNSHIIDHCFDA
jgi:hypothetical protein